MHLLDLLSDFVFHMVVHHFYLRSSSAAEGSRTIPEKSDWDPEAWLIVSGRCQSLVIAVRTVSELELGSLRSSKCFKNVARIKINYDLLRYVDVRTVHCRYHTMLAC